MKSQYDSNKFLGFQSGKLTVVEVGLRSTKYIGAIWKCRCSCNGNIKEYRASLIKNRYTQSCGCMTVNNLSSKFNNDRYMKNIYGDLEIVGIVESENIGVHWECKCIHCGEITVRKAQYVADGKTTRCRNKNCIRLRNKTNIKYNKDEYINKEYNLLKVLEYNIEKYKGYDNVMWKCQCLNCNSIVKLRASQVVAGAVLSCGCLHKSKHEVMIEHILLKNGITYVREVSFKDLIGVGGGKPRFDFAIIDRQGNKKLIEYDGIQHFIEPVITSTWNTERTIHNDKIKNNYCKEHDIELIRISGNFSTEEELERYMIKNRII